MSINIVVICSIHTNIELLPHFISHYKSLGVTKFILGIWQGDRNPIWKEINEYNDDTIHLVKSYDNQLNEPEDTKFAESVRRNYLTENDWYIPTDLDEFHVFPDYKNVKLLIEDLHKTNSDFVWGKMIDRFTEDGSIPLHITQTPSIWEQFPKGHVFSLPILSACDRKVSLAKQKFEILGGHHYIEGSDSEGFTDKAKKFDKNSITYHFKWFGNLLEKEEKKMIHYKSLGFSYYTENEKLINIIKQNNGKIIIPEYGRDLSML